MRFKIGVVTSLMLWLTTFPLVITFCLYKAASIWLAADDWDDTVFIATFATIHIALIGLGAWINAVLSEP